MAWHGLFSDQRAKLISGIKKSSNLRVQITPSQFGSEPRNFIRFVHGWSRSVLQFRTQGRRALEMGPDEAQHERGQLPLVPGEPVVGLGDDAQLVVGDVRSEPPGVLRRDDLVFGAVDRENPAHRYQKRVSVKERKREQMPVG